MTSGLERYISLHSRAEDPLLSELVRETNFRVVQPRMLSGHVQGRLLEMFVRMARPRRVLEIGTFTGYSALCMAAGLEDDGLIDTIEVDDELEDIASSFFARSPHGHKIRHHIGSALDIAPSLGEVYDMVFVDGDKREYVDYYRMLMGDAPFTRPMVAPGSFILVDNILWYGKVAEEVKHNDLHTQRIVEFNDMALADDRVENVILPVRDGINILRVK